MLVEYVNCRLCEHDHHSYHETESRQQGRVLACKLSSHFVTDGHKTDLYG